LNLFLIKQISAVSNRDDDSVAGGMLTEKPNTNISGKIYLILIIINFIIN